MQKNIDVIILYEDEETKKAGLDFDKKHELEVMMDFQDGFAREVNDDESDMKDEENPIVLVYPMIKEVMTSKKMIGEIIDYTSCNCKEDISFYDIALKYGKPMRLEDFKSLGHETKQQKKEIHVQYNDFDKELLDLHKKVCNEIAKLMSLHGIDRIEMPEVEFRMQEKYYDCKVDCYADVVKLDKGVTNEQPYGDVLIESADFEYDEEVSIYHSQYVIPCSIIDLYKEIYKKLEGDSGK